MRYHGRRAAIGVLSSKLTEVGRAEPALLRKGLALKRRTRFRTTPVRLDEKTEDREGIRVLALIRGRRGTIARQPRGATMDCRRATIGFLSSELTEARR